MEDEIRNRDNRPIYLGVLAALSFVIIVFLISIPSTKKKYTSSNITTPGIYQRPVLKPLSSFVFENNQIVRFRSIATGEYYKTDLDSIDLLTGYNTTPLSEAATIISSETGGEYTLAEELFSVSPHFQKFPSLKPIVFVPYFSPNSELNNFIMQKYKTPANPNDLDQASYNALIRDGWYIVPAFPIPIPLEGLIPYLKPYLAGFDMLYATYIAKQISPGTDPEESLAIHSEFVFNTDQTTQAIIDSALQYRNVFRFKRSFNTDNAFYMENVLNAGRSFEVSRHNLIHPRSPLNTSFIDTDGKYRNTTQDVDFTENVKSVALISKEVTDLTKISFYIEQSSL